MSSRIDVIEKEYVWNEHRPIHYRHRSIVFQNFKMYL